MRSRRELLSLVWIFLAVALLYGYRLGFPPELYYDEIYHVKHAREILTHGSYDYVTHPPLGKLLIALSIFLFGDHSWAWRLPSLVAGVCLIFAIHALTRRLTQDNLTAFFATLLFVFDGISLTQARIAMLNAPALLFEMLAVLSLIPFALERRWSRRRAFLLSGLCLGLALSTKLVAAYIIAPLLLLLAKAFRQDPDSRGFLREALICFVLIPPALYGASYSVVWLTTGRSWATIWQDHLYLIHYHLTLKEGHPFGSAWWTWPLLIRPVWYSFQQAGRTVSSILCIGNPAVFWVIPFGVGYALWRAVRGRSFEIGLILLGFLTQWLPYALVQRVKFFHYFDMAMPFVVMAIGLLLSRFWAGGSKGRRAVFFYLITVVLSFVYWYPLLTGVPVTEAYFQHHIWFKSWV